MITHFTPKYFANPTHPISVKIIGCGGTGSLLLTRIARLNHELTQLGHPGISVSCFDDDIIESHNVGRQNFNPNDVGLNKAFVLISKINVAFGLDWEAFPKRISQTDMPALFDTNVLITCVDQVEVRMLINEYTNTFKYSHCDDRTPFYWMDCGNGKDFGQVILSTLSTISQPEDHRLVTASTLKSVVDFYGNLKDHDTQESQGIEGCSFIDSLLKQDLFINDEIALSAAKLLRTLLKSIYISSQGTIINQEIGKSQPFIIQ